MARDKLSKILWYKLLFNFLFWPTKFARTTNMKIACNPRLRREVTAVARRQTYKTFGVGHNSFQDTRHAQEVTSCSWAARQTVYHSRWTHRVCWVHAHLEVYHHQHPQELARPRSCQNLLDYLRETVESNWRHSQDSLVESVHFPWFFHVLHWVKTLRYMRDCPKHSNVPPNLYNLTDLLRVIGALPMWRQNNQKTIIFVRTAGRATRPKCIS